MTDSPPKVESKLVSQLRAARQRLLQRGGSYGTNLTDATAISDAIVALEQAPAPRMDVAAAPPTEAVAYHALVAKLRDRDRRGWNDHDIAADAIEHLLQRCDTDTRADDYLLFRMASIVASEEGPDEHDQNEARTWLAAQSSPEPGGKPDVARALRYIAEARGHLRDAPNAAVECLDEAELSLHANTERAAGVCEWEEIEAGSGIYNTCKGGEEFHLTPGLEVWPYCHLCGGKIEVTDEIDDLFDRSGHPPRSTLTKTPEQA